MKNSDNLNNQNIIVFESIDSTNLYLKNNYCKLKNNTIVRSNFQTSGYGKVYKKWESSYGENLLLSILKKRGIIGNVCTRVCIALIRVLEKYGISTNFEFPNDIYFKKKKLLEF